MRGDGGLVRGVGGGGVAARRPDRRIARRREPGVHLDFVRRLHGRVHVAGRSAGVGDDPDHHRDRPADSHLLDRLHARGERFGVRPLLLVPQPVRRVHARARPRRELPRDVRRLGGRRPLLVSAHRLLVSEEVGVRRRQEGLHRQPDRRLRVHPGRPAPVRALRHGRFPGGRARRGGGQPGARRSTSRAASRACTTSARSTSA